jgi:hypothetical protein
MDVAAEIIGIRPLRTKLLERGRGQRLTDRALVPNIGAKAGIESGGPDDRKSAFF